MNCKKYDLAVVISENNDGKYYGMLVEIIKPAPNLRDGSFLLPNLVRHEAILNDEPRWIIRSVNGRFPGALGDGRFGVGRDSGMMPVTTVRRNNYNKPVK